MIYLVGLKILRMRIEEELINCYMFKMRCKIIKKTGPSTGREWTGATVKLLSSFCRQTEKRHINNN